MSKPVVNPFFVLIIGVVGVSFGSIFVKAAEASPIVISFYRMLLTVLVIAPFTFATGWHELRTMSRRDVLVASSAGIMLAFHLVAWISSLSYTTIASSTVLVDTNPIFVIIGGYLIYQEKIGTRAIAGAALAIAGCIIIGLSDFRIGGLALYGDILALLGAILVAGYMLVGRGLRSRLSLLPYIAIVYSASTVTLLIVVVAAGLPFYPYPAGTWLMFLLLALVPTIMGHTIFNWAFRYVKGAVVSVCTLGEPVGATILAYFIFHQVPTVSQVVGGTVIIAGLVLFILSAARESD